MFGFYHLLRYTLGKMDTDEEDGLSGLTQNSFLLKCVIPDEGLRLLGGVLENEDLNLFNIEFITSGETSKITKPTCV